AVPGRGRSDDARAGRPAARRAQGSRALGAAAPAAPARPQQEEGEGLVSARTIRSLRAALVALAPAAAFGAEVRARVTRSTLAVGESTTLEVTVTGAIGGGAEPDFDVPSGIEVLGSDKAQSYSWVN